jgi:hypothetical protein
MKWSATVAVCLVFLLFSACSSSRRDAEPTQSASTPMSAGTVDNSDLAVGLLFSHGPPGWQPPNTTPLPAGEPWVNESCTGNLIAPDVVLTAGHCFDVAQGEKDLDPKVRMDSFYVGQGVAIPSGDDNWQPAAANMKKYTVDAFVRPSNYAPSTSCPPSDLDIAVLHLSTPVVGVTPLKIATSPPPVGATVKTIGFGVHPIASDAGGVSACCVQSCTVNCTCLSACGCKNLSNYGGVCVCNDPTVNPSYDQLVRRTANVSIAAVLTSYLHQTNVSQSTDLPGDSGGAVIYKGEIVGTDDCGNGCADAQTDQYFVRADVAYSWIMSQVALLEGDAGTAVDSGAPGATGDSGAVSADSGGTPTGGEGDASGGSASGGASASGDAEVGGVGESSGGGGGASGCAAASASAREPTPSQVGLVIIGLAAGAACTRRTRRPKRLGT